MTKKRFYQRKVFYLILFIMMGLGFFFYPFIKNPIGQFRKTVLWILEKQGVREKNIRVNGYYVRYFEGGEGKPENVLLLHGFGGNSLFTWMRLLPDLSKEYHVLAPDLLASNFLRLNPNSYSIDQETKLVSAFLEKLNIQETHVVGLSAGGWVALLLAKNQPNLTQKLILVESAGIKTKVPELVQLSLTDREKAKKFMKLLFHYPPPLPNFVLDQLVKTSSKIQKKYQLVYEGFLKNSLPYLLDDQLDQITQPTLIIHGTDDQVIPLSTAKKIHEGLPNAELVVFQNSGHAVVWDSPWKLKQAILGFLKKPLK